MKIKIQNNLNNPSLTMRGLSVVVIYTKGGVKFAACKAKDILATRLADISQSICDDLDQLTELVEQRQYDQQYYSGVNPDPRTLADFVEQNA